MKNWLLIAMIGIGLLAFSSTAIASEMDKGSAMDRKVVAKEKAAVDKVNTAASDKEAAKTKVAQAEDTNAADAIEQAIKKGEMKKSDSSEWGVPISARAIIAGTQEGSKISGSVDFVQTGDGIQVVATMSNVPRSGQHGIHIHAEGSCDDGGKAAGGHFNPTGTNHGLLPRDGHGKAHTGDMGNIKIDEQGNGALVIFMPGLSLTDGHRNVAGKTVILHEKEDDFGQPTGNAGARIGCGVINLSS